MLRVIRTRLRSGNFNVRVGDSSRRSDLELRLFNAIIIIITITALDTNALPLGHRGGTSQGCRLQVRSNGSANLVGVVIMIIIIAFKGAIRDFLQSPHSAANCLQYVCSSGPGAKCANHAQHIERLSRASVMLRATWYEGTAQLLSLTELKSHLFELYINR